MEFGAEDIGRGGGSGYRGCGEGEGLDYGMILRLGWEVRLKARHYL